MNWFVNFGLNISRKYCKSYQWSRGIIGPLFWIFSYSEPPNLPPIYFDYFLWDYVKLNVYIDEPAATDALKDNIEEYIREIPAEMVLCQNWT